MQKVAITQSEPKAILNYTTPLAAGATHTSADIDVRNYISITGFAFSDQSSAANGFKIRQAMSTADFDLGYYTETAISITGGSNSSNSINVAIVAPYARIVYTNGAVAQTIFRLVLNTTVYRSSAYNSGTLETIEEVYNGASPVSGGPFHRLVFPSGYAAAGPGSGVATITYPSTTDPVPVSAILMYAGTASSVTLPAPPTNWEYCDGTVVTTVGSPILGQTKPLLMRTGLAVGESRFPFGGDWRDGIDVTKQGRTQPASSGIGGSNTGSHTHDQTWHDHPMGTINETTLNYQAGGSSLNVVTHVPTRTNYTDYFVADGYSNVDKPPYAYIGFIIKVL